ncbi:MAG TPA: hypothetical protein VKV03_17505 [Candidatus Binataceae bacterium]|nr:hypothetical protein [Candidatus Binataceae bacterium]
MRRQTAAEYPFRCTYLYRPIRDANLDRTVAPARLRSSFIYLANAVNDLSGDWAVLALVLAPLIVGASLCLLPDALNIQHRVAHTFDSEGGHGVNVMLHRTALREVQTPYRPEAGTPPAPDPFPFWMTISLHVVFLLISLMVGLVALCGLVRRDSQPRAPGAVAEAIEVYKRVLRMTPAFLWITFLQYLVIAAACLMFMIPLMLLHLVVFGSLAVDPYVVIPLLIPGLFVELVLYFCKIALVFGGMHSWPALLHSRELERGRFLKVAMRIVVFFAVWSGYNSWASGAFLVASILLGPVVAVTGYVWSVVFVLDLLSVGVAYFTTAFFVAASVRLYQDLTAIREQEAVVTDGPFAATTQLPGVAASVS